MAGKLTKTEKYVLAMAGAFLALMVLLYGGTLRTKAGTDYTVTAQYELEAPEAELVNVNTASREELEALSGIGPSLAQRIIDHRNANGPFRSAEDLLKVSGIGKATLDKFRSHITVS